VLQLPGRGHGVPRAHRHVILQPPLVRLEQLQERRLNTPGTTTEGTKLCASRGVGGEAGGGGGEQNRGEAAWERRGQEWVEMEGPP